MANIIDGRKIASQLKSELKAEIEKSGLKPGLAAVLVGENPQSQLYLDLKEDAAREIGIYFEKHELPENSDQATIISLIERLNKNPKINGIIVQLPLPDQLNASEVISAIKPTKDADGFQSENLKKLARGDLSSMPVMGQVILKILNYTNEPLKGKSAVIVGKNDVFTKSLTAILSKQGTNCLRFSPSEANLKAKTSQADILISALGQPGFISAAFVKSGAIVIDIGTKKINGVARGDVDFEGVNQKAAWLTPVPGGVGPITVALLLKNVFELSQKQQPRPNRT